MLNKKCCGCNKPFETRDVRRKYCSKECSNSTRRKTAKRVVVMCRNCGSMILRLARDLRHGKDTFCDVECANEYKAIAYQDASYKERYRKGCEASTSGYTRDRLLAGERKAQYALDMSRLMKGWTCCAWCDKAFNNARRGATCSDACRYELNKAKKRAKYISSAERLQEICKQCGNPFEYRSMYSKLNTGKIRLLCSDRCSRKLAKQVRKHWKRTSGPKQSIDLISVAKKFKWICASCGCKCIKAEGNNLDNEATLDHIHPLSKGGLHILANAQLLCRKCNTTKGCKIENGTQLMLPLIDW